MDRKTARKASNLLLAIEELERFEDQLVDLLNTLEDTNNYNELFAPIRDVLNKVIEKRNEELEGL
jgi:hypothetical protein